ncbi:hypothetical protein pdam_00004131 [Pocillopora damicornis]|uniref:Uncharacterized protein n=1 Tax=Pocillopora damicornis TaxID=46731 RepID=A0A3M6TWP7_POCDA|nr:hypothetical protein pdam_00004131 [Pocillopora damicornis]
MVMMDDKNDCLSMTSRRLSGPRIKVKKRGSKHDTRRLWNVKRQMIKLSSRNKNTLIQIEARLPSKPCTRQEILTRLHDR